MNVDWDSNNASRGCFICNKEWSLFNRRHHCRKCGKLVCESCSTHRLKLDNFHNLSPSLSSSSSASGSGTVAIHGKGKEKDREKDKDKDTPQRVCDTCFKVLQKKEQFAKEVHQKEQRKMDLLTISSNRAASTGTPTSTVSVISNEFTDMSSKVQASDSLIDVFYLDGSYQTLYFDDCTTAQDLSAKLQLLNNPTKARIENAPIKSPNTNLSTPASLSLSPDASSVMTTANTGTKEHLCSFALFEVLQDINDPKQFKLIKPTQIISDLLQKWNSSKLKYAKIVVPVYELDKHLSLS